MSIVAHVWRVLLGVLVLFACIVAVLLLPVWAPLHLAYQLGEWAQDEWRRSR